MAVIELTETDEARVEEFAGGLFGACLATMELANVELGLRLGLYDALAGAGPTTAGELAGRPTVSVLDEVLAQVDREVFRRQIQYDAAAHPAPAAAAKP